MEYLIYDENRDKDRNEQGNFEGRRSTPSKKKAVARCMYRKHQMDMSAATVKKRGCLNKNGGTCECLLKYEHEYWAQRERKKAKKKAAIA